MSCTFIESRWTAVVSLFSMNAMPCNKLNITYGKKKSLISQPMFYSADFSTTWVHKGSDTRACIFQWLTVHSRHRSRKLN
jgi:hypothetical protein